MNTTKNQFANLAIVEESDTDEETTQMEDDNETTPLPEDNQETQDVVSMQVVEDEPVVDENPFIDDDSVVIYLNNSNNSPTTNPPGYSVWVGGHVRGDVESGAVKVDKMDTKVPLTITPNVLVNGELLTWYYNYGWYSGSNITGPFQNGSTVKLPNVNMTKLDVQNSALNFITNIETLPEKCLGKDLYDKFYLEICFGNLALLKYELPENDWNNKINIWLNKLNLEEDFNMAFSVIDNLKTMSSSDLRKYTNKLSNRKERLNLQKSKNPFLYYYAKANGEKNSLLNSLKN
jgi:hypothetical protein